MSNLLEQDLDDLRRPQGRFIILVLFLFLFSSCTKDKSRSNQRISNSSIDSVLQEAKYSDMPVPIGYTLVASNFDNNKNSEHICYSGSLPINQVIDYYRVNLESCGWQISNFSSDQEGLLFCDKKNKSSIVSVRLGLNKNYVYIFFKNKLKEGDSESNNIKDINSKECV